MFIVQKHYQGVSVSEKELVWFIWKTSFWFYDGKIIWVWCSEHVYLNILLYSLKLMYLIAEKLPNSITLEFTIAENN